MSYSTAYHIERAELQREHAHAALESSRKDRIAVARQHLRRALAEIKSAKEARAKQ